MHTFAAAIILEVNNKFVIKCVESHLTTFFHLTVRMLNGIQAIIETDRSE